jgi:hypothetical protein
LRSIAPTWALRSGNKSARSERLANELRRRIAQALCKLSSAQRETEPMPSPSVPIVRLYKPDGMVLAIEALRERADAEGQAALAYLLLIAEGEAQAISPRARAAQEQPKAGPDELWRPA